MKHLNSIYILLEAVDAYNWELISDESNKVKYNFEDLQGNQYLVEFKGLPDLDKAEYFIENNKDILNKDQIENIKKLNKELEEKLKKYIK